MSKRRRSVLLKVWLFVLVFLPLTISLGFWQLERAEQKQDLLLEQQQKLALPERKFVGGENKPARFEPVYVEGSYRERLFFLDNRQRDGQVGYEVLNEFELEDGSTILVNRGWVRAPKYRTELPQIALMSVNGKTRLSGYFYEPERASENYEHNLEAFARSQWRIQALNWDQLVLELGRQNLIPVEFRLRSEKEVGALKASWNYVQVKPEKHRGYAFQWFAMACALLILATVASFKVAKEQSET